MATSPFQALEYLSTSVLLLDAGFRVVYANPAAEVLFELSANHVVGLTPEQIFVDAGSLPSGLHHALAEDSCTTEHELMLATPGRERVAVSCTITPVSFAGARLILEFHPLEQQMRIAREERMNLQQQANRELIRNLAHEIKNPLGGIRGAAQLLEHELPRPGLKEYTQVIINESDRLQSLMDRLLTPHRQPKFAPTNIHEVLERVRSVVLAETPDGIRMVRDYDVSLPDLMADKEQLIQAMLNIVRNAVQAMQGQGEITLRTRITRRVTLAKKLYRLAAQIQVIDNGPGIPDTIRDRIFYPLISAREGGTGLGLTLAQTFVQQHQGSIECDSRPGLTCFTLTLPIIQ